MSRDLASGSNAATDVRDTESVLSQETVSATEEPTKPLDEHNYFEDSNSKTVMSPKSAIMFAASELNCMKDENDRLNFENRKLRESVSDARKARFSFESIKSSDHLVKMYKELLVLLRICLFSRS